MLKSLEGKKSYLGAAALFVLGGLFATGIITRDTFESLAAMVGAFTAASMRSAMNNL